MQIGNQRSKLCSSLISTKRAQLLTSPLPLGCDHPTSLPSRCAGSWRWPLPPHDPCAGSGDEGAAGARTVCLCLASFSLVTLCWCSKQSPGSSGVMGWHGVGEWEPYGTRAVTLGMEEMVPGCLPPSAHGFISVQPQYSPTRWLRSIPASPREIRAGECGVGVGCGA